MKIVVNPHQDLYSGFVQTVHRQFDKTGTLIFKHRNELRMFNIDGFFVNVKKFRKPYWLNRIVYTFFSSSKAQRSYHHALKLIKQGIETPEPIAYILIKQHGLLHVSYYVSRHVEYDRNMYEFGIGGIVGREQIVEAFAVFTAGIHEKGVYHKDYSPGNILFKAEGDKITFCLVDINRMRFGRVSIQQGCANFARLWGQMSFFELALRKYAEQRRANPEECFQLAMRARRKFWNRYAFKHPIPFALE